MSGKNNDDAESRWRKILSRQAGSGVSVRKFCTAEGISEPSFYAWRRKLRQRRKAGRRLAKARPRKESDSERLFVPLQLVDAAATLQIVHPLGYRIQVPDDVDPVALRLVIEALDQRGAR